MPTSLDLQAFIRHAQPDPVAGMPVALLANELPEIADFLAVDFTQASGNNAFLLAGGPAFFSGIAAGEGASAGIGYGRSYGYGAYGDGSASTASARAPGQNTQLASDGKLPAGIAGPLSGFYTGPAPTGPSAISLDDPALVERNIEPSLHLALAPTTADIETGGKAGNGVVYAVPEPTTVFLLGLGLLGLLATRRTQYDQRAPLDS